MGVPSVEVDSRTAPQQALSGARTYTYDFANDSARGLNDLWVPQPSVSLKSYKFSQT